MDNSYLAHHGIKGMKWGVRRTPEQLGHRVKSASQKVKSKVTDRKKKTDPVKQMSDDELRKRINRIQMEKQYKQLTAKQTSAGQKFVKDVMVNAAKQTATQYASKAMVKGVEALIKAAV